MFSGFMIHFYIYLFIYLFSIFFSVNIIHYRMITVIIDFLSMSFAFVWMYSIFVMYA